ncbi:HMCN [Mytilus edulis]|uniref:HMCN n=1 Tax=Mytilus edulis TaxID=6550 RepID=A0A8S3R1U4_MYTED|nr:HMCN [Mytilus edulis]
MYCSHEEWGGGNCNHNEDVGIYCFNKTAVLGGWSQWTTWSLCSNNSRNDGLQSRSRRYDLPLPSDRSFYCNGTSMEIKPCNSTLYPGSRSITQSDLEGNYSLGVVVGVGVGCIIMTIILVVLSQYAILHWRRAESYDDLRINQSTSDYSVRTNHHNTNNITNRESNVPFETTMVAYIVTVVSSIILAAHLIQAPSTGDVRLDNSKDLKYTIMENGALFVMMGLMKTTQKVVCRQLGYSNGISLGSAVDDGEGTILLESLQSTGSESKLVYCSNLGWKSHDCSHSEDVGVLCNNQSPVNGGWTTWSLWNSCNVSCGEGMQFRFRSCNNPTPAFGGLKCSSKDSETKQCFNEKCPKVIDGGWSKWAKWTDCTKLCNGGLMERARTCDSPPPINGGLYCNGTSIEANLCNTDSCSGEFNGCTFKLCQKEIWDYYEELYIYQESDQPIKANTGFKEDTEELYIYQESDNQPTQSFNNSAYIQDYNSKEVDKAKEDADPCDIYENYEENCYENY